MICLVLTTAQCKGGPKCGPLSDPSTDADADCIANTSDNCPFNYNPSQSDVDSDGVGTACDLDDSDSSVGSTTDAVSVSTLTTEIDFPKTPETLLNTFDADSDCSVYIKGCDDVFLGFFSDNTKHPLSISNSDSPYGDETDPFSILNPLSFYGRSFTSCSALNKNAIHPPELFCLHASSKESSFLGFLHSSPENENEYETCVVLSAVGIEIPSCEE